MYLFNYSFRRGILPLLTSLTCLSSPLLANDTEDPLLQLSWETDASIDATPGRSIEVSGGKVVADERFGNCLSFGADEDNKIVIKDSQPMDFSEGFTFDAWLKFEPQDASEMNGTLLRKNGTASFLLNKGKPETQVLFFPTEEIYKESGTSQYGYYPVDTYSYGGLRTLPTGKWINLRFTYDPVRKVARTWLDGGLERMRYMGLDSEMPLLSSRDPIQLFNGLKNFKVANVRVSGKAEHPAPVSAMEVYVHQLPYSAKQQAGLLLDSIDPTLKFPIEIAVYLETHQGLGSEIERFQIDGPERLAKRIDLPSYPNAQYNLMVQAFEGNREVLSRTFRIVNPRAQANARATIQADHSIKVHGKQIFPLMIYRVPFSEYQAAKEMGFNIVAPHEWDTTVYKYRFTPEVSQLMEKQFEAANRAGILIMPHYINEEASIKFRDEKSLLAWYLADEPWKPGFEGLLDDYNRTKLVDPSVPTIVMMGHPYLVREGAEIADIVGRDPYPIPDVSLRNIADSTRMAVRDSGGFKPVWITVCQYVTKIPTYEQLRCMLYIAIASGANGLGVYSWDERVKDPATGKPVGWHLPKEPTEYKNLSTVITELASLEKVLIVPNAPEVGSESSDNKAVHVSLKKATDGTYLFIASDSRKGESATFTLPLSGEGVEIWGKSPAIEVASGKLTVDLPAYGVRVYRFSKNSQ